MTRSERRVDTVICDAGGCPQSLRWRGRSQRIVAVLNRWRIETGWWDMPVQRDYYKVLLDEGSTLLLVWDATSQVWAVRRVYG